jgi:hypothetical protein
LIYGIALLPVYVMPIVVGLEFNIRKILLEA